MPGNGPRFDSIDEVQAWAFRELMTSGKRVAPRGKPTRELLGYSFTLNRPRARIVVSPERRWSLPLAIGEFCWHVSGSRKVEGLAYYASRWSEFADSTGMIRGSCYGHRIFARRSNGLSRWDALITLLRADPATRRAVLSLSSSAVPEAASYDISCALTLQAVIRDGRLHLMVQMRSNDVVWGLPYDVFLFTMLQEMLAGTLGVELGVYVHSAGSLHIYDRHAALAARVLSAPQPQATEMPTMTPVDELAQFVVAERAIRKGKTRPALSRYWSELADVLEMFARTRYSSLAKVELNLPRGPR